MLKPVTPGNYPLPGYSFSESGIELIMGSFHSQEA